MSENIIQYVAAAGNGDTDAMAKLYSKTLKASYFLASILCSDAQEAVDITKKAYARAFCTIDKLKNHIKHRRHINACLCFQFSLFKFLAS